MDSIWVEIALEVLRRHAIADVGNGAPGIIFQWPPFADAVLLKGLWRSQAVKMPKKKKKKKILLFYLERHGRRPEIMECEDWPLRGAVFGVAMANRMRKEPSRGGRGANLRGAMLVLRCRIRATGSLFFQHGL